jgi:hypothetical protein
MAINLALCFTLAGSESGTNEDHNTLQNLMTELMLIDPKMISKFFLARFDGPWFDMILKTNNSTIAKEILSSVKQSVFIPLRYVVWPPEIILHTRNS